jgi:hypothetical protein
MYSATVLLDTNLVAVTISALSVLVAAGSLTLAHRTYRHAESVRLSAEYLGLASPTSLVVPGLLDGGSTESDRIVQRRYHRFLVRNVGKAPARHVQLYLEDMIGKQIGSSHQGLTIEPGSSREFTVLANDTNRPLHLRFEYLAWSSDRRRRQSSTVRLAIPEDHEPK